MTEKPSDEDVKKMYQKSLVGNKGTFRLMELVTEEGQNLKITATQDRIQHTDPTKSL